VNHTSVASGDEEDIMEDDRLNRFSRMLAARYDRRALTGLVSALGLAALLGLETDIEAKKKKKKKKRRRRPRPLRRLLLPHPHQFLHPPWPANPKRRPPPARTPVAWCRTIAGRQ
jgi:hypothetical protein